MLKLVNHLYRFRYFHYEFYRINSQMNRGVLKMQTVNN